MRRGDFTRRLKHILSEIKRGSKDSTSNEIITLFVNNVWQKAGDKWYEVVAAKEMEQT